LVVRPTPIYAPVIEAAPKELSTLLVPKAKGDVSLQKFRCGRAATTACTPDIIMALLLVNSG
jgi:hypothetical protein